MFYVVVNFGQPNFQTLSQKIRKPKTLMVVDQTRTDRLFEGDLKPPLPYKIYPSHVDALRNPFYRPTSVHDPTAESFKGDYFNFLETGFKKRVSTFLCMFQVRTFPGTDATGKTGL